MFPIQEMYGWEVEHEDHVILRQYSEDGQETPSTMIRAEDVRRATIFPRNGMAQRADVLIDRENGERFVRRFGRGIIKDSGSGFRHAEYLHCIETTKVRVWVLSTTGQVLVTKPDFELYP